MRSRSRRWVGSLIVILVLIGLFQIATSWKPVADALGIRPFLLASPTEIAGSLRDDRSQLADAAATTLVEVIAGFTLALISGVALALLVHRFETARRAIHPLLIGSQAIPVIAIAPILIVWFGFGLGPKLAIIALVCFFPITVNTMDGLRRTDPQKMELLRSLGASRSQLLVWLEAPSALPFLMSGAKVAAAIAVIAAVFAEWSGSNEGLGYLIQSSSAQLLTARMFAAILVLSLIGLAMFWAIGAIERKLVFWDSDDGVDR